MRTAMIESLRSVLQLRPIQLDAVERRLRRAANIDDLRTIARRRLPRGVFDYIDGGGEDELSLRRNILAFRCAEFRPRVLRDVAGVDPSTTLLGRRLPLPLVVAPTGFTRVASLGGELDAARVGPRPGEVRADHFCERRRQAPSGATAGQSPWPITLTRSSTRRCPGATSTGSAPTGRPDRAERHPDGCRRSARS